jgi:pyruvate kinase
VAPRVKIIRSLAPPTDTPEAALQMEAVVKAFDGVLVARGDLIVMVAGTPPGAAGTTNSLRAHRPGMA